MSFGLRPFWAFTLSVGCFWLGVAAGQEVQVEVQIPGAEKPAAPALSKAQQREQEALARINEKLDAETKIDVVETPFTDVMRDVAKEHDLKVVLDPVGLEMASVTPDQLVNVNLRDISLRSGLRTLLHPLGLTFVIRNEGIAITSLDVPDRLAVVRTFPLGDLLTRMDDPSELITTLEMIWPDSGEGVGENKPAEPRARILAGHLVVRGSPRHIELAESLINGLMRGGAAEDKEAARAVLPRRGSREAQPVLPRRPTSREPEFESDAPTKPKAAPPTKPTNPEEPKR